MSRLIENRPEYEVEWLRYRSDWRMREVLVKKYGFAIPNLEALVEISRHQPVLEVGAGSGYWAYELKKLRVDIVATGIIDKIHRKEWEDSPWTAVERLSAQEAIGRYPERTLFMCWPSYSEEWAGHALAAYGGETLILVAEGEYGCVGGSNLWEELRKNWQCLVEVEIPQWDGIHDWLTVWRRRKP